MVINSNLGDLQFSLDADGKGLYREVGASEWTPFLSGGAGAVEVWTNENPSSSLAAQTISIDLSPYTNVLIEVRWSIAVNWPAAMIYDISGGSASRYIYDVSNYGLASVSWRSFTASATGVMCSHGNYIENGVSINDDQFCIPVRILAW